MFKPTTPYFNAFLKIFLISSSSSTRTVGKIVGKGVISSLTGINNQILEKPSSDDPVGKLEARCFLTLVCGPGVSLASVGTHLLNWLLIQLTEVSSCCIAPYANIIVTLQ